MQEERPTFGNSGNGAGIPLGTPKGASRPEGNRGWVVRPGQGTPLSGTSAPTGEPTRQRPGIAERIFDSVITISIAALFFGIPIFFTGATLQGIVLDKQIYFYFFLLVALVAWVSKGVVTGEMRIRRTVIDIPIVAFVAFYGVDVLFSVDRWHSLFGFFGDPSRGFLPVLALAISYFLIASHYSRERSRIFFSAFVASGLVVILWSFLVLMAIPFLPASWRTYAPLSLIGTVSTLATFLSILVPVLMTAIFMVGRSASRPTVRNGIVGALGVFLLIDLFLIFGLGPYVSWWMLIGGLGFFLLYILAQVVRPGEQWTWIPMLVFVLALVFFMWQDNSVLRANLPIEVAPSTKLSWTIATSALAENFFFGTGPASYGHAFSMFRPVEYNSSELYQLRFYEGGGLVFETLTTMGAVGGILLLALWLSFVSAGVYLLSSDKDRNKLKSLGLWTVAVMFLIGGFFVAANGTLVLIGGLLSTLALLTLLDESGSEPRYLSLSLKASPKFALTLAFVFMVVSAGVAFLFVFMGKVLVAEMEMGSVVRADEPSEDMVRKAGRAIGLYPHEGRYRIVLAQEYMALANVEGQKPEDERNIDAIALYVRAATDAAATAQSIMKSDVLVHNTAAQIYENASLYAGDAIPFAFQAYEEASTLEPNSPVLFFKLGQMKRALADRKPEGEERMALLSEAKGYFGQAVEKKPNLAVAHYFLANALLSLKEYDDALVSIGDAIKYDPNNLTYRYSKGTIYQARRADGDDELAEAAFLEVLGRNERLIDVRLSLGLLYEGRGEDAAAIREYERTLTYLPEEGADVMRDQIKTLIDNVRSGRGNLGKPTVTTEVPAENAVIPPVTPEPETQPEVSIPAQPAAAPAAAVPEP